MFEHRTMREQPFGPQNPPPSMEAALAQLRQLEVEASSIQTQLDTTKLDSFTDEEAFRVWKKRAASALAHKHAESRYLERWAGTREGEAPGGQGKASTQGARAALERIIVGVRETVASVRAEYQPRYSVQNQPKTLEDASERWKLLSDLNARIDDFLTEVNRHGSSAGVRDGSMTTAKQPLTTLKVALGAELVFLNKYLEEKGGNWMFVLLRLVERAVQQGLEMSPDEQIILNNIRHFRQTKLKRNA